MKRLSGILILLLFGMVAWAQHVTVSSDGLRLLYQGMKNPISIAVENCNCNNLLVTTDNGILQKTGPCKYNIDSLERGSAHLTIKKNVGNKVTEVGKQNFKVIEQPAARMQLAGNAVGSISKVVLSLQMGLICSLNSIDTHRVFKVAHFRVVLITDGPALQEENIGGRFNENVKALIDKAKPGDRILFDNMMCFYPDENTKQAFNTMIFKVVP